MSFARSFTTTRQMVRHLVSPSHTLKSRRCLHSMESHLPSFGVLRNCTAAVHPMGSPLQSLAAIRSMVAQPTRYNVSSPTADGGSSPELSGQAMEGGSESSVASSTAGDSAATSAESEGKPSKKRAVDGIGEPQLSDVEGECEDVFAELQKTREEHRLAVSKVRELQDKLLRSLADQENSRQRYSREVENARVYAISNFAKAIVEVADNLSHATEAIDKDRLAANEDLQKIYEGVKLTGDVLHNALDKFGIVEFNPAGEPFDPKLHEALFEMEDPTKSKGQIAQVVQTGYKIQDRILRAAKVGVVKG